MTKKRNEWGYNDNSSPTPSYLLHFQWISLD
jgi:hypothetical protein